ncbi:MAG: Macrolide export ATP-binding/permease protein MacB [Fimbriimonadaceae bacterium]|nr:Macrolide export ATP-binding/permease protein MacB [Fimbriimonadaceae bacterium]
MGTIARAFGAAAKSLIEQRWRAALSSLGVMVGATAIVLLISIALGVQKDVTSQVEDLGVNLLIVLPGRIDEGAMLAPNLAGISYLSDADVDAVRRVPGVRTAGPLMFVGGGIQTPDARSPSTFIIAATPEWFRIRPVKLAEGRVFQPGDERQGVCVIGSIAREKLFGQGSAIGRKVNVNGSDYEVIGVTEDKKQGENLFSMGGFENIAYIPYGYLRERLENPQVHRIMIQTDPEREPKTLVRAVESALDQRLDRETFSVLTQEDLLKLVYRLMSILTWLLTGLTSIALFVGGVGIMTVMLMSVNERTKEIGIRKTAGAKNRDIFWQFLFEALLISAIGGIVGLGFSVVVCQVLAANTVIKPLITPQVVLLCFSVSIGLGCLFGILPAMSAARRDPVRAMQRE